MAGLTKITGSQGTLTDFTSTGIDDNADATSITIDSSEKVGIGETSPLGTLHIRTSDASLTSVNGNADDLIIENNGNCGMTIASSTTGEGNINFVDSGDTNIGRIQYHHSDNRMVFRANDSERMRIVDEGLLINCTSTLHSGVERSLEVENHSGNGFVAIFKGNTAGNETVAIHNSDTSGTRILLAFKTSGGTGTLVGRITSDGSTTTYATSSDHRLKENVEDMTGAIDRVKQLLPKRFNFINDDTNTLVDGFLAHEAQSVVAEAVSGTHNEVDDDGEAVMQGIDQSKLVPLLTGALKEAIAKIEDLEARIATLEGN